MAIPLTYNLRNLVVRRTTTIAAAAGMERVFINLFINSARAATEGWTSGDSTKRSRTIASWSSRPFVHST